MEFGAIGNSVVVKGIFETHTKGGFVLPDTAEEYKQYHGQVRGEVMAVGSKSEHRHEIKKGDFILFRRHEGKRFIIDGEKYFKLKDRWVMGKEQNV